MLFAVIDCKTDLLRVECSIRHGFTAASDVLILKTMLSYDF